VGVTKGLAGMKFSTSPRANGCSRFKIISKKAVIITPIRSLTEKKGWNGILSRLELEPMGLLEPVW
jgi:hypothetical protein